MLWQFCLFQVLSNTAIPTLVYGLYTVTEQAVLQGLFVDAVVINILFELIIPALIRRGKRARAKKLEHAMEICEKSQQFKEIFQNESELETLRSDVRYPEVFENFGFSFRLAFSIKTVFVSMTFNSAYPTLALVSILHLLVQYLVDLTNCKIRYNRKIWIPFPSLSLPVIRYMLLLLPSIKIICGIIVYASLGHTSADLLPMIITLAVVFSIYWVLIISDLVSEYRKNEVLVFLGLPSLPSLKERGFQVKGSYHPPANYSKFKFEEQRIGKL